MKKLIGAVLVLAVVGVVVFFSLRQTGFDWGAATAPEPGGTSDSNDSTDSTSRPADAKEAKVAFVHDGDTLYLQPPGTTGRASELTVRLIGLDTPEIRPTVECLGIEARDYLRQLLPEGSTVWYTYDRGHLDKYDRNLMYLWTASGTFVNLDLVEKGYATALKIAPNDYYWPQLRQAEDDARHDGLGIWGEC